MTKSVLSFLALVVLTTSCSGASDEVHQDTNEVAVDVADMFVLSPSEIARLTRMANREDIESAKQLYDYYLAHEDDKNVTLWEDWLIRRHDPEAAGRRASIRFSQAAKLNERDPRKLALLKEADSLQTQALKYSLKKEDQMVLVNGRWTKMTAADMRGDEIFAKRVRQELARTSRLQKSPPS